MSKFIGKVRGFGQRHFSYTESRYCPMEAKQKTSGLVRSRVTLQSIRDDVCSFGGFNYVSRPSDPVFDEVVKEAANRWRLTERVKSIHLNDLPSYRLATDSSSPGLPWRELGFYTKRQVTEDKDAFTSIRSFWHKVKYTEETINPPGLCRFSEGTFGGRRRE